jgi:hypothetical protein
MSSPNPVLVAVKPEILNIIDALTAFDNAMGPDFTKWGQNFPGAKLILDGTVLQQLVAAEPALGSLAVTGLNGIWAGLAAKVMAATS